MQKNSFDIYSYHIGIPLGEMADGDKVILGLGHFPSGAMVNGYQIFSPNEIAFINKIIKSGHEKYESDRLKFSVLQCDKYYDLNLDGLNDGDEYFRLFSLKELAGKLSELKDEIELRREFAKEGIVRSSKVVIMHEVFHFYEEKESEENFSETEREVESLMTYLTTVGYHFGIYFLAVFRYHAIHYFSPIIKYLMGRLYGAGFHPESSLDFCDRKNKEIIKSLKQNEMLFIPNEDENYYKICIIEY